MESSEQQWARCLECKYALIGVHVCIVSKTFDFYREIDQHLKQINRLDRQSAHAEKEINQIKSANQILQNELSQLQDKKKTLIDQQRKIRQALNSHFEKQQIQPKQQSIEQKSEQHYCNICKKPNHCWNCCSKNKKTKSLVCDLCHSNGHQQQCCSRQKKRIDKGQQKKTYRDAVIDDDGADWMFGADSYICESRDAVVENSIKLKQTRQKVEKQVFEQKIRDGQQSLQVLVAKDRLFDGVQNLQMLNQDVAYRFLQFVNGLKNLVVWFRVVIPSELQYMRDQANLILQDSLGVGATYIDMDTFNVEGLWGCCKEKLPQSRNFLQVIAVNDVAKIWREYLVYDENKMAEYEFVYKQTQIN